MNKKLLSAIAAVSTIALPALAKSGIIVQTDGTMESKSTTISSPYSPLIATGKNVSGFDTKALIQFPIGDDVGFLLKFGGGRSAGNISIGNVVYANERNEKLAAELDIDVTKKERNSSIGLEAICNSLNKFYYFPVTGNTDDLKLMEYIVNCHGFYAPTQKRDIIVNGFAEMQSITQDVRNIYEAMARKKLGLELTKLLAIPKTRVVLGAKVGGEYRNETYKADTPDKTLSVNNGKIIVGAGLQPIVLGDLRKNPVYFAGNAGGYLGIGNGASNGADASFKFAWGDWQADVLAGIEKQEVKLKDTNHNHQNFKAALKIAYRYSKTK